MENRNRFGLDKMNDELVNDILPFEFNLPKNQKNLLATLIYINGIDNKDKDGFFYVDNKYLMEVLGVSEPTIISNANKLIEEGFIQRVTGKKNHPSKYLVTDLIKEYTKEYTKDFSKYTKEYTKKYTKNFSKNFSKTVENFSQDKDIDKEKDKEYIFNIINNIIKENNINLINNINYIIKKEIENIKEKENLSSINEKKEIETMRELSEQVNSLQEENAKLTSRLDNCAKQFKQMMQTIKELQLENKKMMQRIDELEAKQNNTSTTSSIDSSSIQEKSDSKPSNDSALTTIHQEEEKPTESKEMPLNGKELRYIDTMTDKHYATEAEAQQDGVRPNDLYDTKVGRCLTDYTSSLSPSNDPSGIIAQDEQEKPTDSEEMPSTAIVEEEDDANQEKEEKAKKHMYFKEVTILNDEILDELKKNYPTSEWPKLFKIDWANHTIVSKTSRDIWGYGEESKELRDMIAMDSKETKRLMKMVGVGV